MAKQDGQRCQEEPFEQGFRLCGACRLTPPVDGIRRCSRVVAESPSMRALLTKAAAVATTDASVVLLGESGSGKEVVARMLHANGPRKDKAFVAVNVAALPGELLESELFGHVKGAFTGAATAKRGLMEAADGGTLLLDEIAEMPLPLQAKLLRALQDGEIRRVGDTRPFTVNVRVLCATHQDLRQRVADRRFREDLYYRLKVFTLRIPPLRERQEDVLPLARMLLTQEGHPTGKFHPEARRLLEGYSYPGNVRELANAMKHAAVLSRGMEVAVDHLPEELSEPVAALDFGPLRPLAVVEREHIVRVLEACGGEQLEAARVLGIGRTTLWRKLRDFGPVS